MSPADRYDGLSGRERSTVATVIGIAFPLALFIVLHFARGLVPIVPASTAVLKVFDVPPPPPPPPPISVRPPIKLVRIQPRVKNTVISVRHAARNRSPSIGASAAIAPIPIEPIVTAFATPIALDPAAGSELAGKGGSGAPGGKGDGDGKDGGAVEHPRLTAAAWVRPPTREDFQREWPKNGITLTVPVQVVLVCAVRSSGKPFRCAVDRESLPGKGFGGAAIRLAEISTVRPVLRDGRWTDRQVIMPLVFEPAGAKPAVPDKSHP